MPPKTTIEPCPACGHVVSRDASTCPNCGHPVARKKAEKRAGTGCLIVFVAVLVLGGIGAVVDSDSKPSSTDDSNTPTPSDNTAPPPPSTPFSPCDSDEAAASLKKTFSEGPYAKLLGVEMIDVRDQNTMSADADEEKCRAIAVLSNDTKHPVSYRFDVEDGKVFIHMQIDDVRD